MPERIDATDGIGAPGETDETETERTRFGGVAALVSAGAFVAVAGVPGAATAVAVAACWYLLGGTYAFALGQVGVAGLLAGSGTVELLAVELALFGMLFAPAVTLGGRQLPDSTGTAETRSAVPVESVLLALALVVAGVALWWAAEQSLVGVSVGGVLLVAATGVAGYGLRRYRLSALGTAGESRE